MRTIGVVTVGRSDYGIYLPVLRRIREDAELRLQLFVSGMHLSPEFGSTGKTIEADGFEIAAKVEMLLSSDTPEGIAKSMGLGVIGFAQAYATTRPDLLVVLGDRFEMMAAALAALPFKIPVAHIHGGEVTHGAIDESLRHSITKLSHLHFVATEDYGRRVAQLGEEPWRITVSGAPSLDNLQSISMQAAKELEDRFGINLEQAPLLVTFHPATLEYERTEQHVTELLAALDQAGLPLIFTLPNADTSGRLIVQKIKEFVSTHHDARMIENLGAAAYFSLMAHATAMVGNSSSGIIEAASFKLPVVNVGNRQAGRTRAANVIDVGNERGEILSGIRTALDPAFKKGLSNLTNPYFRGNAAQLIVEKLRTMELNGRLTLKKFHDLTEATTLRT